MDKIDKRELIVHNKSKKTVFSIISPNDSLIGSEYYSEFKHDENYVYTKADSLFAFRFEEIESGGKVSNHDRPRDWDSYFGRIENKKLCLYIISKDSVEKYGWYKIFKKNIYNKKYQLSLYELEKSKWEIVYE